MKTNTIAYWFTTALAAFFIGSGGAAELLQIPGTVGGLVRLGYPPYFGMIIGFWKVLGAIALLVPRFPRLKEWAYAGIFFNMTGAAASNLMSVGEFWHLVVEIVLAAVVLISWALRPVSRKLLSPALSDQRLHHHNTSVAVAEPA